MAKKNPLNRTVKVSVGKLLNVLNWLREEQGTTGWGLREQIADMLGKPPTKEEAIAFIDSCEDHGIPLSEALEMYRGCEDDLDEIWYETAHLERPIAELMRCWDEHGNRIDPLDGREVWLITPEKYRS